ncbi:SGNH/GDSL hydrolase family protein [Rhodopirellula baltica]|nr:SGNH/GDSL hydrolase family protein [Rhodopirellula baltica]
MKMKRRTAILLSAAMLSITMVNDASAQRKKNPAFAEPEIDKGLPNVLLIGDSISIGYMLDARKALAGKANVFRPATNCGPTTNGIKNLDAWLGDRHWDVIHFNFGLHDLKYMGPNNENLAAPDSPGAHQQVSIDDYTENIRKIAERLKKTGATVIWRETTPVPEGAAGRVPGDSVKYNEAAASAIAKVGDIQTDPFFAFAESISELQRPANVHYTPEGSKKLGEHVAAQIAKALY